MAGPAPVPVQGDRDAWCRERMEFVCAVVQDVDQNSLKAQLDRCETEDEAEAILQSLLWLKDYNARQIIGDLDGNLPHNEIFVDVVPEEPRVNPLHQEERIDINIDREEDRVDSDGVAQEGAPLNVLLHEERIDVHVAHKEPRMQVVLHDDGELEEEQNTEGEYQGVSHRNEELHPHNVLEEENKHHRNLETGPDRDKLQSQRGVVDSDTQARNPVNLDQYPEPGTSRNQGMEDVVILEAEGCAEDQSSYGSDEDLEEDEYQEAEEIHSEVGELAGQENLDREVEQHVRNSEQSQRLEDQELYQDAEGDTEEVKHQEAQGVDLGMPLGQVRMEEREEGATVIEIEDPSDDDNESVSDCSLVVVCGEAEIEVIDITDVASGESIEEVVLLDSCGATGESSSRSKVDEKVTLVDEEKFEDASVVSLDELFSRDEEEEETEYLELEDEVMGRSQEDEEGEDDFHTAQEFEEEDRLEANNDVVHDTQEAAGNSESLPRDTADEVQIVQEMVDEDEQLARLIAEDMAEEERRSLEADERLARMIYQEMQRQESEQELRDAELARRLAEELDREDGEPINLIMDGGGVENEVEIEMEPQNNQGPMEWNGFIPRGAVNRHHGFVPPIEGPMAMAYQGDGNMDGRHEPLDEARRAINAVLERAAQQNEEEMDELARGQMFPAAYPPTLDDTIDDEVIAEQLSEEGATVTWEDTRRDQEMALKLEQEEEELTLEMEEKLREDEEMARQIEEGEMEVQAQELNEKTGQFADLLTMFPDANPAYLQERCEGSEEFQQVVEALLELQKSHPKDPRISGHLVRRKQENIAMASTSRAAEEREQQEAAVAAMVDLTMEEGATGRLTYECTICFEEEVPAGDVASCSGPLYRHHFCIECVRKHVAAQIGLGNNSFKCMNGFCQAEFTTPTLSRVMEPQVLKKVEERRQTEEVVRAGIRDLVACPFCCYMVIMPDPHNRVLECRNPECLKDSCRVCREPSHIPLRCEEVERDNQKDARILLENRMAEAIIRSCPNCNKRFIIDSGCNKMTCTCGTIMCYVCKQVITNSYNHFEQNRNVASDKCPLYSNPQDLHGGEVRQAVERTRMEFDPNLTLVHDPTLDLP